MERWIPVALIRTRLQAAAEEEAVAGIQGSYMVTGDGKEGEVGEDERRAFSGDVGEVMRAGGAAL